MTNKEIAQELKKLVKSCEKIAGDADPKYYYCAYAGAINCGIKFLILELS